MTEIIEIYALLCIICAGIMGMEETCYHPPLIMLDWGLITILAIIPFFNIGMTIVALANLVSYFDNLEEEQCQDFSEKYQNQQNGQNLYSQSPQLMFPDQNQNH